MAGICLPVRIRWIFPDNVKHQVRYSTAALRCEMSKKPQGATNCQRQRRSADMDLTLQESKTHARASANRKRTRATGTKPDIAVQTQPRTGGTNEPQRPPNETRQPAPATRARATCQPNQGGREPRGETTANNPLTAPMLPGTKTSTKAHAAGKNGIRGTTSPKSPPPPRLAKRTRGRTPPDQGPLPPRSLAARRPPRTPAHVR